MPVYQCLAAPGVLTAENRPRVAEAITAIHSEVTGAPRQFVNVFLTESADGELYNAGKPSRNSIVSGFIRAGRDRATREQLLTRISTAWTTITGQPEHELVIGLIDVDPTSSMEAGLVMPAPGEEAAWFEKNHERLAPLLQ